MSTIVIVGSGMMGSALAFPARENGNTVRLVGSPLDGEIIDACRATNRHPKFAKHFPEGIPPFPAGVEFYKIDELDRALEGADLVIGGVSSFGVDWFGDELLPRIPVSVPVLSVTKGLFDTPDGKPLRRVWARGVATDYAYDASGDLANVVYSDNTPSVAYARDRLGRVVRAVVEGVSTNEYAYSLSGLLTNEVQNGVVLSRTYDDFSRATGYVLHDGLLGA